MAGFTIEIGFWEVKNSNDAICSLKATPILRSLSSIRLDNGGFMKKTLETLKMRGHRGDKAGSATGIRTPV
jgi:hypothetical protein